MQNTVHRMLFNYFEHIAFFHLALVFIICTCCNAILKHPASVHYTNIHIPRFPPDVQEKSAERRIVFLFICQVEENNPHMLRSRFFGQLRMKFVFSSTPR